MPEFFETRMGQTFYNAHVPRVAKALERIADAAQQTTQRDRAQTNALLVLVLTPHIRAYLTQHDPMALEQALDALGDKIPATTTTPQTRQETSND